MSRLRRFLHIERSRAVRPGEEPDPSAATAERIGGVERPGRDPGRAASSGADLDRFAPPPPAPLELASTGAGERPFTRCMRCGMDHHVFATGCTGCGASLDTGPQRAFNERLWAERRTEAAREAAADAERRELRARTDAEEARARRGQLESVAREIGDAERRRLDAELGAADGWDAARRLLARLLGGWRE